MQRRRRAQDRLAELRHRNLIVGKYTLQRRLDLFDALAPQAVMSNIAEALVATAVGLVVAIPAVAANNYFQRLIRATLANMSDDTGDLRNGMGGGDRHFVFYTAWIATRVAKLVPDGADLTNLLLQAVRREMARQTPDGQFPMDKGVAAGLQTSWVSYYDPKSAVAYVPVLTAHLARGKRQ